MIDYDSVQNLVMTTHTVSLKGLVNIVEMRENGAKVVTSMLDVQFKII